MLPAGNTEKLPIRPIVYQGRTFFFEDEIYQQTDDEAMGSPLGPILVGIFMV